MRSPSRGSQASGRGKRRAENEDDDEYEDDDNDPSGRKKVAKKAAMACHFCRSESRSLLILFLQYIVPLRRCLSW
jgi:hypothetical protein